MTERKRECRMKKNKEATIENMNSLELESLLKTELARDEKDYLRIHHILEKLKSEAKELPEVSQEEVEQVTLRLQKPRIVPLKTAPRATWKKQIAIMAAVLCLVILAAPVVHGIPAVQKVIAKWNDDLFWIESTENQQTAPEDYVFQTDNPGLQQLYDAVTELGITAPVVPMWLPEGSELVYLEDDSGIRKSAYFKIGDTDITYHISAYDSEIDIHKGNDNPLSWNLMGINHFYVINENDAQSIWSNSGYLVRLGGNIEECVLYEIIKSIYYGGTVD